MTSQLRRMAARLTFVIAMSATIYYVLADEAHDVVASVVESQEQRMSATERSEDHVTRMIEGEEEIPLSALPLSAETLTEVMAFAWCHQKNYRRLHLEACMGVGL